MRMRYLAVTAEQQPETVNRVTRVFYSNNVLLEYLRMQSGGRKYEMSLTFHCEDKKYAQVRKQLQRIVGVDAVKGGD